MPDGFLTPNEFAEIERQHRSTMQRLRHGNVDNGPPTVMFSGKFARLWETGYEHKAYYGGRGTGKSMHICAYETLRADTEYLQIVNCREFQRSVHASSKRIIEFWINRLGLRDRFKIGREEIWSKHTDARGSG